MQHEAFWLSEAHYSVSLCARYIAISLRWTKAAADFKQMGASPLQA